MKGNRVEAADNLNALYNRKSLEEKPEHPHLILSPKVPRTTELLKQLTQKALKCTPRNRTKDRKEIFSGKKLLPVAGLSAITIEVRPKYFLYSR